MRSKRNIYIRLFELAGADSIHHQACELRLVGHGRTLNYYAHRIIISGLGWKNLGGIEDHFTSRIMNESNRFLPMDGCAKSEFLR